MVFFKNVSIVLIALVLLGCKKELTQAYLLHHPEILKEEVNHCQSITLKTAAKKTYCDEVMNTAAAIMLLINVEEENPEMFGTKIMKAEYAYMEVKIALQEAEKTMLSLKANKQATFEDLKKAAATCDRLNSEMKVKQEEVQILLAVAGINSPN